MRLEPAPGHRQHPCRRRPRHDEGRRRCGRRPLQADRRDDPDQPLGRRHLGRRLRAAQRHGSPCAARWPTSRSVPASTASSAARTTSPASAHDLRPRFPDRRSRHPPGRMRPPRTRSASPRPQAALAAGADILVIGRAITGARRPRAAARRPSPRASRPCPLKSRSAASRRPRRSRRRSTAGADFVGFVFFPKPARATCRLEQAAELADQARGRAEDRGAGGRCATTRCSPRSPRRSSRTSSRRTAAKRRSASPTIAPLTRHAGHQGDQGAATPPMSPPPTPMPSAASLILYRRQGARDADGSLPGGNGVAFDWTLLERRKPPAFMLSGGLDARQCRGGDRASPAPPWSMCRRASKQRPASRTRP